MRRFIKLLFIVLGTLSGLNTFAQESTPKHDYDFYFHWGYNRSQYSRSDIHFKGGDDFDFTIKDVSARDVPERFSTDAYLNPKKITIPQFNFRLGVKIDDKWAISFGWDHLKYFVRRDQDLIIDGRIGAVGGDFAGNYDNQLTNIPGSFLEMEHTDGLNFIHLNADRIFKLYEKKWFKAQFVTGFGTGPVCPWTDTRLFDTFYRNPSIHFAGWGISVNASPRVTLFDRFFVEGLFRVGHIQLWDVMIIRNKYTAAQKINYYEHNITAGFIFPLNPSKNGNSGTITPGTR
ncbi:MAG: hypothetical protein V4616_00395 [Bacteroidota bacterium]